MGLRATNTLLCVVGLVAVLGVLYLAGCFTAKIGASHAAAILKSSEPSWKRVVCHPYEGGYWDYTCRVDSRRAGRFSFEVKVNGNGITDQSAP